MIILKNEKTGEEEEYTFAVFKILTKFPNGTPRKVERIPEEGSTHLEGGEEFMVCLVKVDMLKGDTK